MYKTPLALFVLLCSFTFTFSQTPDFEFTYSSNGGLINKGLTIDATASVYLTGTFSGTLDFYQDSDPSNDLIANNNGKYDIYIAKVNALQQIVFAKSFSGKGLDSAVTAAVDGSGNLYVAGNYKRELFLEPMAVDPIGMSTGAGQAAFIAKYGPDGTYAWHAELDFDARSFQLNKREIAISDLVVDEKYLYITGVLNGFADFNDGDEVSAGAGELGEGKNIFIAKYDLSGNLIWAKTIQSPLGEEDDEAGGIDVDPEADGGIYVSGGFSGTADFDPGTEQTLIASVGKKDGFVARYSKDGDLTWVKPSVGLEDMMILDIKRSTTGIYATGWFMGSATFNPTATSSGEKDVFLVKYDKDGNFAWSSIQTLGGDIPGMEDNDVGLNLLVDESDPTEEYVFITGVTTDGLGLMAPAGKQDVFFAKYKGLNGSNEYFTGYGNTSETDANPIMVLYTPIGQTKPRIVLMVSQSTGGADDETNQIYFASVPQPAGGGGVAPVEWLDFQARVDERTVVLEWATATEYNNDHFVVERSVEGLMFEAIGSVDGVGNSRHIQQYQAVDERPLSGISYYRIRQVDFDGTSSYSQVVAVEMGNARYIRVYPNPVQDRFVLEMMPQVSGEIAVGLFDEMGRLLMQRKFLRDVQETFTEEFALPGVSPGRYRLRIQADDEVLTYPLIVL